MALLTIGNPRRRRLPLASPFFLQRVTMGRREIVLRSDGQLMLAALFETPVEPRGSTRSH
jgi:hypothetical protein